MDEIVEARVFESVQTNVPARIGHTVAGRT
jgi:hypothetical protein